MPTALAAAHDVNKLPLSSPASADDYMPIPETTGHQVPPKTPGAAPVQPSHYPTYEFIASATLAERWCLPESWVREHVRSRSGDQIPHVKFGKYVRFRWGSPELEAWAARRIIGLNNSKGRRDRKEVIQ
jgi:hypothetical protein